MNQPTSAFSSSESRWAEDVSPGEVGLMRWPESQASQKHLTAHSLPSIALKLEFTNLDTHKNHHRLLIITRSLHSSGSQSSVPRAHHQDHLGPC